MRTKIPVKIEPSRKTQIEIKRIIAAHEAKPVKPVRCQVCGREKQPGESCCDETDNTPFTPVTDNEIRWDEGKGLF